MIDTPLQPPIDIRAGRRLAKRYRLEHLVAHGGMASVWLATDEQLRRPVAIKLLHEHLRDPISLERFRGEGKLAAQLSHPGIVAIYDTFTDHGRDGIVLEYVDGVTLRTRLDTEPRPTQAETTAIITQVAQALAEAHRRGLIHRDIKPANILLGSRGAVKVTDFGIAKLLDGTDVTQPGTFVGTAKYLAPEQVTGGAVDGRVDVYALGVVLYEMLTGAPPFVGDTDAATALARLQLPAPPIRRHRADLAPDIADLVDRMLDRAPDRRPTMHETAAMLVGLVSVDPVPPLPTPVVAARRFDAAMVSMAVFVVAALVLAAALFSRTDAGRGLLERLGVHQSSSRAAAPISLTEATLTAFDPGKGDGHEHDDLLPLLHDNNPATAWMTETYSSRNFGGLKDGVGVIVDLGQTATLSGIRIQGASSGWTAAIYVAKGAPDAINTWGMAIARRDNMVGDNTITFPATSGRTLLLWITDLGDAAQVRIGELQLLGS